MHGLYTESREEPARSKEKERNEEGDQRTSLQIKLKGRTVGGTSLKER